MADKKKTELEDIRSKSFKEIGEEKEPLIVVETEEEAKKIREEKIKTDAETKAKTDLEVQTKREQEIADKAADKAKISLREELKKAEDDKKLSDKEKEEEKDRIRAKWTGKDEKTGVVTPLGYDEIVSESVRLAKEEAAKDFDKKYAERRQTEKEEADKQTKAQQAEAEVKTKQEADVHASEETRINREMDVLIAHGDLEKPEDLNNKEDPKTKKYQDFLGEAIKYNTEHPDAKVTSPIEFYNYHYKSKVQGQAGGDAPIAGNRSTTVSTPTNDEKYNYVKDHNKSFRQIRDELTAKFRGK